MEAMNRSEVTGMTVTQVLGCGIQKGTTEFYRGAPLEINWISWSSRCLCAR